MPSLPLRPEADTAVATAERSIAEHVADVDAGDAGAAPAEVSFCGSHNMHCKMPAMPMNNALLLAGVCGHVKVANKEGKGENQGSSGGSRGGRSR